MVYWLSLSTRKIKSGKITLVCMPDTPFGASRQEIEQLVEHKIAPLKKDIDEIKAMLRALQKISKIEQNTEAILEDTESIRRNVEPTDEGF